MDLCFGWFVLTSCVGFWVLTLNLELNNGNFNCLNPCMAAGNRGMLVERESRGDQCHQSQKGEFGVAKFVNSHGQFTYCVPSVGEKESG